MQEPLPYRVSIEEFLPILAQSEGKLELIDGIIVARASGTIAHARLADRAYRLIHAAAKPPCTAYSAIMAVSLAARGSYVFPDASYTCERVTPRRTSLEAPRLVVEVLSPESVHRDRVEKVDGYRSVPSILEYLLIDSRTMWICLYRRNADDAWTESIFLSGSSVRLAALDLTIDVDELYRDILE